LKKELTKIYQYLPTILDDERIEDIILELENHKDIDFNLYEIPKEQEKIRLSSLDYN
jgi:hypothetical protein